MIKTNEYSFTCIIALIYTLFSASCSIQNQVAKGARKYILQDSLFASAHVGICIYDPSTKKYVYNYQGNKYFIPASNTKLLTCYSAMKYLGDSLIGLRYVDKGNGTIEAEANGDPTFLHPDFKTQPVFSFLKGKNILLTDENWKEEALGYGWAWDDYNEDYMVERSVMPVYGNIAMFSTSGQVTPPYFQNKTNGMASQKNFGIKRNLTSNSFEFFPTTKKNVATGIPFYTKEKNILIDLLKDTLHIKVDQVHFKIERWPDVIKIHSQPTDSLLKIMMHRSDNFFAEQSLLMVSNEKLGVMNDARIIDTLLNTDFKDLPQKPKWVDGSGLSRYNLISPQDFVAVLEKMKNEFNWNRITTILASGGDGTLGSYYKNYAGKIYAKTGTLSNNVALSGYIITHKGKQYIFSVMVNNHLTSASSIRRAVEKFITEIIDKS